MKRKAEGCAAHQCGGRMGYSAHNQRRSNSINSIGSGSGSGSDTDAGDQCALSNFAWTNDATADAERHEQSIGNAEKMLAKEMNELSVLDRNNIYEEIHGCASALTETPEFLNAKLAELDLEVKQIAQKNAYERAAFMSPNFVHNRDFKIMFLRCDHFEAKKSAVRMIKYFDFKLELFGLEILTRRVRMNDMNEGDMAYFQTGTITVLPNRDQRGRRCYAVCQKFQQYRSWENLFRATFYFLEHIVADDEATQTMGAVLILYNVGFDILKDSMLDRQVMKITNKLVDGSPLRNTAVHYCYNDKKMLPALAVAQLALGKSNRLRFRTHYGSHMECQYSLMSFGIDPTGVPYDAVGNRDLSISQRWIDQRRQFEARPLAAESAFSEDTQIDFPLPADVLLGRGRPYQEWPGNKRLAEMIDQYYPVFSTSDRTTKTSISKGIVQMVHTSGGRFLKKMPNALDGWMPVSDYDGREKVSHAFRNKKQRSNAERK